MRNVRHVFAVLLVAIAFCAGVRTASGQEQSKESKPASKPKVEEQIDAYRIDLTFTELEDGKKLNTRHYSINLTGGQPNEIKIGTRVPVASARSDSAESCGSSAQYQYLDIGTRIWAQLLSRGGELRVDGEISSLDTTAGPEGSLGFPPVVRQIRIEGSTPLVLGKPIIIGSADDPNSRREFQLEATVTKVR